QYETIHFLKSHIKKTNHRQLRLDKLRNRLSYRTYPDFALALPQLDGTGASQAQPPATPQLAEKSGHDPAYKRFVSFPPTSPLYPPSTSCDFTPFLPF
ncbi:MAG: hypothetical protein U9N87_08905, partial [Planctomycetota bacterium]|nr:hypothetical protein [Planctomycetota bacterium]